MNAVWTSAMPVLTAAMLAAGAAAAEPQASVGNGARYARTADCVTSSDCVLASPKPEVNKAMEMARAALDKVVATYQVDQGTIKNLVKGSQGFAVLQDLVKEGFIFAQIHGHGFLVYRQADGRWGPPLMLEVSGVSFGPQFGARISDVLVVFKTTESIRKLLTGQLPHGLASPSGSVLYGNSDTANLPSGIVTYSLHRGFMLGQSVDEYHIRLLEQANLSLYGEPLNSGELVDIKRVGLRLPLPVQMFVEHVNGQLGETTHQVDWTEGGKTPER
jgi:lipid-binding SYLF domain-containing protein